MLDHNRGGDDEFKTEVGIGADSCGNGLQVNFVAQFWQEVVMLMLMVVVRLILMAYMQKTCDDVVMAILAKKKLRKKCVNSDKM